MSEVKLSQEKWNMILDMKDKQDKQQDELDRLRRMYRALDEKLGKLEVKLMKANSNEVFQDIFKNSI